MTIRILAFTVSLLAAFPAFAATSEAAKAPADLPKTVIVRVKNETGEATVFESNKQLNNDQASIEAVSQAEFKPVASNAGPSEMDRTSSTSSWFAWYYNPYAYFAPTYYYGGYSYAYRTFCNYTYYGYTYYWYRPYGW